MGRGDAAFKKIAHEANTLLNWVDNLSQYSFDNPAIVYPDLVTIAVCTESANSDSGDYVIEKVFVG